MTTDARPGHRGRPPLPQRARGTTLSCYIPRWAIEQLQAHADREQLPRNMLVRRILLDYLAGAGPAADPGRATGPHAEEGRE